ncbi:unnamed protein product [Fraxinus pennsylvanica]|uniref:Uncharacterized protein n=1 Tax=Fraxinus pennsylvanica TaxID=56036 RepID=A0AAD2E874_9LAMI|nr:unnamed protein product [Fraxinus pennsylvanica]
MAPGLSAGVKKYGDVRSLINWEGVDVESDMIPGVLMLAKFRGVEVVEETLKGHEVRLLTRKTLPALDLPKVRKNNFVEILPINVSCLGAGNCCKTKHARGHLGSYTVDSLALERIVEVLCHPCVYSFLHVPVQSGSDTILSATNP